jgi:putative phosphoribosyl transferase
MVDLKSMILFKNRKEAVEKLIKELPAQVFSGENTIILGVSKGGSYFASYLARELNLPMNILLTEPIYSLINPKLSIAMVGETEEVVIHKALVDAFNIPKDYIYNEAQSKYSNEILAYIKKYRNGEALKNLEDKYVILADECVETGLTMMTAVKTAISLGAKSIFIAVPVLDNVVYENLVNICDNIFCPHKIDDYISIEYYYEEIEPFSFEEIAEIMKNNEKNQIGK